MPRQAARRHDRLRHRLVRPAHLPGGHRHDALRPDDLGLRDHRLGDGPGIGRFLLFCTRLADGAAGRRARGPLEPQAGDGPERPGRRPGHDRGPDPLRQRPARNLAALRHRRVRRGLRVVPVAGVLRRHDDDRAQGQYARANGLVSWQMRSPALRLRSWLASCSLSSGWAESWRSTLPPSSSRSSRSSW